MSHSFVSNLMHCTFSTRERFPFIDSKLESRLWPYIGGIANDNRMKPLAIGGTKDHLHAIAIASGNDEFREGGATHKRRIFEVDP